MEAKLVAVLITFSLLTVCSAGPRPDDRQKQTASTICESRLDRTISVVCDGCQKEPLLSWLPPTALISIVAHECCKTICTYEKIKSICCRGSQPLEVGD